MSDEDVSLKGEDHGSAIETGVGSERSSSSETDGAEFDAFINDLCDNPLSPNAALKKLLSSESPWPSDEPGEGK